MIVTTEKLLLDGRTLGRCLTVLSPRLVDQVLVALSMARSGVQPPYKIELDSLEFGLTLTPEGEPTVLDELPDEAVPCPVRARLRPSLYFLEEFYALLSGLAARRPMQILGDEESAFQVDGERLVPELQQLEATHTACQPGFNDEVVRRLSTRLRDDLLIQIEDASPEFFSEILVEITDLVAQKRLQRGADGLLATWFQVYGEVFHGLDRWLIEQGVDEAEKGVHLARSLGYGCAGACTDPLRLLNGFLENVRHPSLLDRLARRSLKRSQQAVARALKADTQDDFEQALYGAATDLLATRQMSLALERKSAALRAQRRLLDVCLALTHCLQNRSGERLELHRALVQKATRRKREELLDELIEQRLLYPRCMRETLVSPPDAPSRA